MTAGIAAAHTATRQTSASMAMRDIPAGFSSEAGVRVRARDRRVVAGARASRGETGLRGGNGQRTGCFTGQFAGMLALSCSMDISYSCICAYRRQMSAPGKYCINKQHICTVYKHSNNGKRFFHGMHDRCATATSLCSGLRPFQSPPADISQAAAPETLLNPLSSP